MLDNLISLAKDQLAGQLQSKAGLNAGQVDQTMDVAKDSLIDTLKDQAMSGNLNGVMDLFNGKASATASNPIVSGMVSNFAAGLVSKLGIPQSTAITVTDMVVPFIMSKFSDKSTGTAANPEELMKMVGIDGDNAIGGILKNVMGDNAGGLMGGLGKLFG